MRTGGKYLIVTQIIGLCYFSAILLILLYKNEVPYFGELIYNYYFLSLLDGQYDIPIRLIGVEGHYTPDGRAYVYHGLAPLITRLLLFPFIDLSTTSIAPFSIWLFCTMGTALYALTFARTLRATNIPSQHLNLGIIAITSLVWLTSPALILLGNHAFFTEPIAIAFFAGAGVLFCAMEIIRSPDMLSRWVIPMACFAASAVHARPAVAVGLYCIVSGLIIRDLLKNRSWLPGWQQIIGLFILGLSGLAFLAFNYLRFGDPMFTHGSFEPGPVEYGFTFWKFESPDSDRARMMNEAGQFNLLRVIPNAVMFVFRLTPMTHWLDTFHAEIFKSQGSMYTDPIQVGLIYMWLPWLVIAGYGIANRKQFSTPQWIMTGATGFSAILLLSYPAITMRYSADLWPFIAVLVLFGLPYAVGHGLRFFSEFLPRGIILIMIFVGISFSNTGFIVHSLLSHSFGDFSIWTQSRCMEIVERRDLAESEISRLCEPPQAISGEE